MTPSDSPPLGLDRLTLTIYGTDTSLDQLAAFSDGTGRIPACRCRPIKRWRERGWPALAGRASPLGVVRS
jgi:hypothetical protein